MATKNIKYISIKEDIIQKIHSSEYRPNQILPSESELCKIYNVSRITIRKALDELLRENILYSIKGKGSFVKETSSDGLLRMHSFTKAITYQGKTHTKKVLSFDIIDADDFTKTELNLTDDEKVYKIKTLYLADDVPYCISISTLPVNLFKKLEFFDFSKNSLYDTLKTFYNMSHTRAKQIINAIIGDDDINSSLNLMDNKPLLKIQGTSYGLINEEELKFELYESYIITDIFSYYVEK